MEDAIGTKGIFSSDDVDVYAGHDAPLAVSNLADAVKDELVAPNAPLEVGHAKAIVEVEDEDEPAHGQDGEGLPEGGDDDSSENPGIMQFGSDDEDDDDSSDGDWMPGANLPDENITWHCTNCTQGNEEDDSECDACGMKRDEPLFPTSEQPAEIARPIIAIGYDERMQLHKEGKVEPHPERPDRLAAIHAKLQAAGILSLNRCLAIPGREITKKELLAVHTPALIEAVEATSAVPLTYFSSDTYANEHSALCARLAAGTCVDVVSAVLDGDASNGIALVRPPGHHADSDMAMGFCLHNNMAVAARAAQAKGAERVLIVDWDVHHGNGTQQIFEDDPSVLFISLHRHDNGYFYPGTGAASEVGRGAGAGFSVNVPWPTRNMGDADYMSAFLRVVMPIAHQFNPHIVLVSAGFDAAAGDMIGGCQVTPAGYAHMTHLLKGLAGGRVVLVLEGGYNLRSIANSAEACARVLLGEDPPPFPADAPQEPSRGALVAIAEVCRVHSLYWRGLASRSGYVPAPELPREKESKGGAEGGEAAGEGLGAGAPGEDADGDGVVSPGNGEGEGESEDGAHKGEASTVGHGHSHPRVHGHEGEHEEERLLREQQGQQQQHQHHHHHHHHHHHRHEQGEGKGGSMGPRALG
eukprot:jgi/Mesvir1/23849/Mv10652-RA.1